jgi:hypothetical protein
MDTIALGFAISVILAVIFVITVIITRNTHHESDLTKRVAYRSASGNGDSGDNNRDWTRCGRDAVSIGPLHGNRRPHGGAFYGEVPTVTKENEMDMQSILKFLNYASQAAQLAPAVAQSVAKITDPNATPQDKIAAVQKDVQTGHAIATANGETTQTFDEFWTPLAPIVTTILSLL